jgi:hypothetical protein
MRAIFQRGAGKREIEEELRFHLDLLTDEYCRKEMSLEEARAEALERFGDVERIKNQCVEINRRSHPGIVALKLFLSLVFLLGVLVRIFSPEYHVTNVGNILIAVGILGRLLLYVRLHPSGFLSKSDNPSPLMLNDDRRKPLLAYDQKMRTPLERIISDK